MNDPLIMWNRGVSFGLFQDISVYFLGLILLFLIIYAVNVRELFGRLGLSLIIIGGAMNLYERVVYGAVRDNLNFFGLFYNNFWDYVIALGVVIYLVYIYR